MLRLLFQKKKILDYLILIVNVINQILKFIDSEETKLFLFRIKELAKKISNRFFKYEIDDREYPLEKADEKLKEIEAE